MKIRLRETEQYAVLLIVLFGLAALAARETIRYLEQYVPEERAATAAGLVWALTLGFMLIAGAFGLWTTRFSAKAEGRRRIGRFVDAMDYLKDGLLAVNRRKQVTGCNPEARRFAAVDPDAHRTLLELYPCLNPEDEESLLASPEPAEVEHAVSVEGAVRTLRFRSQPSEDLTLILTSDVTTLHDQRVRQRQQTRLQLLGQISRGVVHDLNNLLCVISGHASLLARLPAASDDTRESVSAINQAAMRGTLMAAQLHRLVETTALAPPTCRVCAHVSAAAELLKGTLSEDWTVSVIGADVPAAGISGLQLEQLVLNLGLLTADTLSLPGSLQISVLPPEPRDMPSPEAAIAGVVQVSAAPGEQREAGGCSVVNETASEAGVLLSVVRTIIEAAGGALHTRQEAGRVPIYRLALPKSNAPDPAHEGRAMALNLSEYVARWSVLVGREPRHRASMEKELSDIGVRIERATDLAGLLAAIEQRVDLDAMILDRAMLGAEADAVLRAVRKLNPSVGVVVLGEVPAAASASSAGGVLALPADADVERIILGMIEARNGAMTRAARAASAAR